MSEQISVTALLHKYTTTATISPEQILNSADVLDVVS